jgi:hypothetical protein
MLRINDPLYSLHQDQTVAINLIATANMRNPGRTVFMPTQALYLDLNHAAFCQSQPVYTLDFGSVRPKQGWILQEQYIAAVLRH